MISYDISFDLENCRSTVFCLFTNEGKQLDKSFDIYKNVKYYRYISIFFKYTIWLIQCISNIAMKMLILHYYK